MKELPVGIERIKEKLDYDPETGHFTWKANGKGFRGIRRGSRAGSVNKLGYRYLRVDGTDMLAARVAWVWGYGEPIPDRIRFRDGDRDNCAIANLRNTDLVEVGKYDWRTKEGKSAQQKAYRATIKERLLDERLRRDFGLSLEQYQQMHSSQRGLCAICGNPETAKRNGKPRLLAVDHCHDSGRVRGLLCGRCNPMIGYAKDSAELLESAIRYLRSWEQEKTE